MPIDTVKLKSPYVHRTTFDHIKAQSERFLRLDRWGEITWERTNAPLLGSWDSRISVQPMNEDWFVGKSGKAELHPSLPYVVVECSIPKVFYGQNIYGGPGDFQHACGILVYLLEQLLDLRLPKAKTWRVYRVDWAECFALPYAAVSEFFEGLRNATFPRRERKAQKHGLHSVHFGGDTTSFKAYHKGPEFAEHDAARLRRAFLNDLTRRHPGRDKENFREAQRRVIALQRLANNRLRVEVGIKKDKLEYDFGHVPTVDEVTTDYLTGVFDREVHRFLKEGHSSMRIVREAKAVDKRLKEHYSSEVAGKLYGFWTRLATLGEESTKPQYPPRTFYRHRRALMDAGVSWLHTDMQLIECDSVLPVDFSPVRTDPRRCTSQVRETPDFLLAMGLRKLAA